MLRIVAPGKVDPLRVYRTLFQYLHFLFSSNREPFSSSATPDSCCLSIYVQVSVPSKGEKIWVVGGCALFRNARHYHICCDSVFIASAWHSMLIHSGTVYGHVIYMQLMNSRATLGQPAGSMIMQFLLHFWLRLNLFGLFNWLALSQRFCLLDAARKLFCYDPLFCVLCQDLNVWRSETKRH